MLFHCFFFSFGHILALISFYSMWAHTVFEFIYLGIMVHNGGSYYVKYCSRSVRLEAQKACVDKKD